MEPLETLEMETPTTPRTLKLSPEEAAFIGERQKEIQTACALIVRQNKLTGAWALQGDQLVQVGE